MSDASSEVAEPTAAEIAEHVAAEIPRLERQVEHYREGCKSTNHEYRMGSQGFLKRRLRDLAVYKLAQQAIDERAAKKDAAS